MINIKAVIPTRKEKPPTVPKGVEFRKDVYDMLVGDYRKALNDFSAARARYTSQDFRKMPPEQRIKFAEIARKKLDIDKTIDEITPHFGILRGALEEIAALKPEQMRAYPIRPEWVDSTEKAGPLIKNQFMPAVDEFVRMADEFIATLPATEPVQSAVTSVPPIILITEKPVSWGKEDIETLEALESKTRLFHDAGDRIDRVLDYVYRESERPRTPQLVSKLFKFKDRAQEAKTTIDEVEEVAEDLRSALIIDRQMKRPISETAKTLMKEYDELLDPLIEVGNEAEKLLGILKLEEEVPFAEWPAKFRRPYEKKWGLPAEEPEQVASATDYMRADLRQIAKIFGGM